MFYWFVYNPSVKRRLKANGAEFRQCAAWQQQLDKNTLILESFKYLEVEFVTFEVNSFSLESSTGLGTCLQGFWGCCTAPSPCPGGGQPKPPALRGPAREALDSPSHGAGALPSTLLPSHTAPWGHGSLGWPCLALCKKFC